MFFHQLVKLWIGLAQTIEIGVVFLTFEVEHFKCASFLGEVDARTVGCQCEFAVNLSGECCSFRGTITESEGCEHIAFAGCAYACAAAFEGLVENFGPKMTLGLLNLIGLGI